MLVFINCKITNVKRNNHLRFNLPEHDRFDVARYAFTSLVPLEPLIDKLVFYLELADSYSNRQQEMESYLRDLFPSDKLEFHWHRCSTPEQWREARSKFPDFDVIYPMCNDDHVFIDNSINYMQQGLELVRKDPDPNAVLLITHYPENIRYSYVHNGKLSENKNFVVFNDKCDDSTRIIKKEFFDYYLSLPVTGQVTRLEDWFIEGTSWADNKMYFPTKEQFRHFDGYPHVGIGPKAGPISIPNGFFEKKHAY